MSSSTIELGAPAKLNLFLEVTGRRPDGYHELDSVFVEIDLCDRIRIGPADAISVAITGEASEGVPADPRNLAWKAAEALGVLARIEIDKRIPAGAGLGGGSSDAASVLLSLDALYELALPEERLAAIAAGLGADVPFFLQGGLARCRGIGEQVEPVPDAPEKSFFLVIPPFASSTATVFDRLDPGLTETPESASFFLENYCGGAEPGSAPYFNRLQATAERLEPELAEVRRAAEERFSRPFVMTGSGSSYFAEAASNELPDADRLRWGQGGVARVVVVRTG